MMGMPKGARPRKGDIQSRKALEFLSEVPELHARVADMTKEQAAELFALLMSPSRVQIIDWEWVIYRCRDTEMAMRLETELGQP